MGSMILDLTLRLFALSMILDLTLRLFALASVLHMEFSYDLVVGYFGCALSLSSRY